MVYENNNDQIVFFGKTNFRGIKKLFGIKKKDRRQHMYVIGKTGTGKTALLHNLVVQDIANGEGLCIIDPHGEFAEEILQKIPEERMNDVIYFNPADNEYNIGFNVLELPDPKYKHLVASGLMGIFTKIWANVWSARMEYILNNAILALLDTPGSTLLGLNRILVDKDYRQQIVANIKDPVVRSFWLNEYEQWKDQFRTEAIAAIQNKIGQFLSTSLIRNIVGQSKSTININEIMDDGKILIVNVSKGKIGEDNSSLLGAMLVTKIQLSAMERVRIPENQRRDFYLYVDEFQNFATDSFASILSEARKYRLNLIIAHQYIGQLVTDVSTRVRDAIFGNIGTIVVFRVGADDAQFLANEFSPEVSVDDFVNLPNYNVYIKLMVDGITTRPFSAETLPPFKLTKSQSVAEHIIESSRRNYTRPNKEVEKEIEEWGQSFHSRFYVSCVNCGKKILINFEPRKGQVFYCDDCLEKIKKGDLKRIVSSEQLRPNIRKQYFVDLSKLGIEFPVRHNKLVAKPHKQTIIENENITTPQESETEVKLADLQKQSSDKLAPQHLVESDENDKKIKIEEFKNILKESLQKFEKD
ncbi:MAG: type IV secretion system DNA-binding domain-containing protein [Minisyncoccia bacterium]